MELCIFKESWTENGKAVPNYVVTNILQYIFLVSNDVSSLSQELTSIILVHVSPHYTIKWVN